MATYTSAQSGLWSSGSTWVGGVKPPSNGNHRIIIAASHVVTYDESSGIYGDDTTGASSDTAEDGAIQVTGTLKFSRTTSTVLTSRGTMKVSGKLDLGDFGDIIPSGVTAELRINDSSTLAKNKHMLYVIRTGGFTAAGVSKTRISNLFNIANAGATSILVTDATGWSTGDELCLSPTGSTAAQNELRNIASTPVNNGNGTWTVVLSSGLSFSHAAGGMVGNFTSNVRIRPSSTSFSSSIRIAHIGFTPSLNSVYFDNVEFYALGFSGAWNGRNSPDFWCAIGYVNGNTNSVNPFRAISNCAFRATINYAFTSHIASTINVLVENCVQYGGVPLYLSDRGTATIRNFNIFSCTSYFSSGYGTGGAGWRFENCNFTGAVGDRAFDGQMFGGTRFVNCNIHHSSSRYTLMNFESDMQFENCNFGTSPICTGGSPVSDVAFLLGSVARLTFKDCMFPRTPIVESRTKGSTAIADNFFKFINLNRDLNNQRLEDRTKTLERDNDITHRGTSSHKIILREANLQTQHTISFFAPAGTTIRVIGYIRRDSNYAGSTLPSVTLSGNELTPVSYTMTGPANAWEMFDLSITNIGIAANLSFTLSGVSTSVASNPAIYLSGILDSPFVNSVRHYGFNFDSSFNRTINPVIQATESAAGLYSGININHTTQTITITQNTTVRQLYDYCYYNLTRPENLSVPEFFTSSNGSFFSLNYDLVIDGAVLSGSGSIEALSNQLTLLNGGSTSLVVTDSNGVNVSITVSNLVVGSRLQLYNSTTSTELLNTIVTSSSVSIPVIWTSNNNIRYRVIYANAVTATKWVEDVSVLTSQGLSINVNQETDDVYVENGIDGFSITNILIDDSALLIKVSTGAMLWGEIYAFETTWLTTEEGVRDEGRFIDAIDRANYILENFKIKNISSPSIPLNITGGWGRDSVTGSTVTLIDNSGGAIFSNPDAVISFSADIPTASQNASAVRTELATELGRIDVATSTRLATSGYTAPANSDIASIKVKTDNLPTDPASNTQVNTRLSSLSYTAPDNAGIAAIKAKTDNLPASPASETSVVARPTLSQIEASTVLAKEATVATRASQSSVSAIPTNPLLTNDTRLNNLDASVSSRLPTSSYVAPANADVSAIKAKTDNLPASPASEVSVVARPTLAQIEASTVLAKESTSSAIKTKTDNLPSDPASNTQVNTRLASSSYTAPDNAGIAGIKAKTDNLPASPASETTLENVKKNTDLIPATV